MKSYFILKNKLFLIILLLSNLFADKYIDLGDEEFSKKHYMDSIKLYRQSQNQNSLEVKLRLIQSYLKLGDNYLNIQNFKVALTLYNKAKKLNSKDSLLRISKVYEAQADRNRRIHKYKKALELYNKAKKLNNKDVEKKIKYIHSILDHKKDLKDDSRKLVVKTSPIWTKSIGKLIIPIKLEFITRTRYKIQHKKCSASLINLPEYINSKVIITASHCLSNYDKNAGKIKFIIKDNKNNMIYRNAIIKSISDFKIKNLKTTTDWAILVLNKSISISSIKPFILKKENFTELQKKYKYSFGSLGGFSSDIAKYGAKLTYDPKCKLKYDTKMYGTSTCTGFNGSSGGPIVLTTSDDNINFKYNFVGVVSHFKNKNFKNIYFTPHNLFYNDLEKIIQFHNK